MALNEALLPEFDLEMANTRKTLERVPDESSAGNPTRSPGRWGGSPDTSRIFRAGRS